MLHGLLLWNWHIITNAQHACTHVPASGLRAHQTCIRSILHAWPYSKVNFSLPASKAILAALLGLKRVNELVCLTGFLGFVNCPRSEKYKAQRIYVCQQIGLTASSWNLGADCAAVSHGQLPAGFLCDTNVLLSNVGC